MGVSDFRRRGFTDHRIKGRRLRRLSNDQGESGNQREQSTNHGAFENARARVNEASRKPSLRNRGPYASGGRQNCGCGNRQKKLANTYTYETCG